MRKQATLFFVCAGLLLATGGVINVISTNAVSNNGLSNHRWEPTSAVGSNWVQGWNEERTQNWVASWGSGAWRAPIALIPPNGYPSLDLTLAWDASRSRFVFAMLDNLSGTDHSVWYGFSNDAAGTSWSFSQNTPVMSSAVAPWDYPSVAVDGLGRVMVGAASESATHGYFTVISTDGVHFTSPAPVSGVSDGRLSRLIATYYHFELFVPSLTDQSCCSSMSLPTASIRPRAPA